MGRHKQHQLDVASGKVTPKMDTKPFVGYVQCARCGTLLPKHRVAGHYKEKHEGLPIQLASKKGGTVWPT